MNKIKFFLEKTKSSIKYLGMIAVIISLSVMFSSLCVMSLLSLSNTLQDSLNDDPRKSVGGDMSITPMEQTEENFNLVKNRLEKIKAEGLIKEYTYTSVASNYRGYNLGKYRSTLVGYEDSRFPLEGVKEVLTPNFSMSELENVENGAVLSDMVAKRENLKVGDTFIIHSSDMYDMHQLKLIGIIDSTISSANNIYVNKSVLGKDKAYTFYVDATGENLDKVRVQVASVFPAGSKSTVSIWDVAQAEKNSTRGSIKVFTLIKGLSVLGLFVGSFGIASAVNTIVIKRRKEIGIMKSIGFTKRDISTMLISEVAVISIIGSVVGVVLGYVFFRYLLGIISTGEMSIFNFDKGLNLLAAGLSLIVSIVSSIIFAYISISNVASLKAIHALRDQDLVPKERKKGREILRIILVGGIFCGISIFLTKSLEYGLGAVVLASIALLIFSLLFRLIFFLILRIRIKSSNFFEFSWDSLKQTYKKLIFAMIAIFIGMFTVNFIMILVNTANSEYKGRRQEVKMERNVAVTTLADGNEFNDKEILDMEEVKDGFVMYKARGDSVGGSSSYDELVGANFDELKGLLDIVEGDTTGVLTYTYEDISEGEGSGTYAGLYEVGEKLVVQRGGENLNFTVTGLFTYPDFQRNFIKQLPNGIYMTREAFKEVVKGDYVKVFWLNVEKKDYDSFYKKVSKHPNTLVESSFKLEEKMNVALDTMVRFSVSVASLALLAGVILIIIVTILDVTSRGRDFAIYKTLGFVQKEVTWMVLLEYGMMTVLTSLFASLMAYVVSEVINNHGERLFGFVIHQKLVFDLKSSVLWNVCLIGLVLALVYVVSRKPLKVKPTESLRYE